MTPFGDALRREREARGVAVADICAATKVSAQHVQALEAGEIKRLPGGVFRKGIVRGYLAALGLDEPSWMARFEATCRELGLSESGDLDWIEFAENVKRGRSVERRGMGWRWVGVALLVVSLWAVAWLAWYFVRHHRMGMREVAAVALAGHRAGDRTHRLSNLSL
jgi:cytoskeletal protein RodZ